MTKSKKTNSKPSAMHPQYWPSWVGVFFLSLIRKLPFSAQISLGKTLGKILYYMAKGRRHIVEVNLRLCFPELSEQEHKDLVKKTLQSNVIGFFEANFSWTATPDQLRPLVEMEGLENLLEAQEKGKGVILLGMHLTTLDLAGSFMNLFADVDVIYRQAKNPVFERLIVKGRANHFDNIIDRSDTRKIFRSLRNGNIIWYAPDQDYGRKVSVFSPFFGHQAATITATARLAKVNHSPIVVFTHYRKDDGSGYLLKISKPLQGFPSGDDIADATTINQQIEEAIKIAPEQYMWTHRRFKTRPDKNEKLY